MAFEAAPANTHIFRSLSTSEPFLRQSDIWPCHWSWLLHLSVSDNMSQQQMTEPCLHSDIWPCHWSLLLHLSLSDNLCLTTFSFLVVRPMAISYRPIMIIGLPRLPFPRSPTLLPILLIHHYPHLFSTMCSHYFAWVWPLSSAPDLLCNSWRYVLWVCSSFKQIVISWAWIIDETLKRPPVNMSVCLQIFYDLQTKLPTETTKKLSHWSWVAWDLWPFVCPGQNRRTRSA